MPDVSVIVPVYNIKTLLPRCVASLQAQTWQDFEVWLVDDGSTDGSGELCDEYAVKDARIHALHKENGGQGSARDLGLDHARGEYICYVDSDDEVLPDLLENALRTAREADADVVVYGYYKQFLDKDGSALRRSGPNLPALSGVYTYEEFWQDFRKAKYESVPWVRFCRRDYLQNMIYALPRCVWAKTPTFLPSCWTRPSGASSISAAPITSIISARPPP